MESAFDELPPAARVAVVRLRSLGDCVLTTPALAILKLRRPDLRVGVVVEARFRAIFEGNPDVDEILPPEASALRRFRSSLCLNLHGGTRSAWLTLASGAQRRAGFGHFRNQAVYNVRIPRAQEILGVDRTVHTAEHLASAIFYLGAPLGEVPRARLYAFPESGDREGKPLADARGSVQSRDREGAVAGPRKPLADARGSDQSGDREGAVATIHAVAAAAEKTWCAEGFLAVAEHLERNGVEPVFIGAAADDLMPFARYRTLRGAPLAEVKTQLAGSCLFVGNDSGPAHMAAAFGLPVVAIFGNSNPAIWGPWRVPSEVVTAPGGIRAVTTEQVLSAVARLRAVHA